MESTLIIADTVIIRIYVRTPNKAEILAMHESSYHLLKIWKAFLHMVDSCGRHLVQSVTQHGTEERSITITPSVPQSLSFRTAY
jgi:hypothetical protein